MSEGMNTTEWQKLEAMVDGFAREMKARLYQKMQEGYSGWNDRAQSEGILRNARKDLNWLIAHADAGLQGDGPSLDYERRKYVDAANRLAMVWAQSGHTPEEVTK